jgi:hypothetical protein
MNEPIPKLEPLTDNLQKQNVGEFLKSREFKRFRIQAKIDEYWRETYNDVKKNRRYYSVGMDHEKYDSIDTLILLLNDLFESYHNQRFNFLKDFLYIFYTWSEKELDFTEIIEDLELLNCPVQIIESISKFNISKTLSVPKSEISTIVDNAKKLEECLEKMDVSIKNEEFNLTLTYAYSSLEGLFKAYFQANKVEINNDYDLPKLSKTFRDNLKSKLNEVGDVYPEQMINLVTTITNAISHARNGFSESHFDKQSNKWLAEFARDCVNSIGRLVLNFLK